MRTGTIQAASFVMGNQQTSSTAQDSDSVAFQTLMEQASSDSYQSSLMELAQTDANTTESNSSNVDFEKSIDQMTDTKESQTTTSDTDTVESEDVETTEEVAETKDMDVLDEKLEELQESVMALLVDELGVSQEQVENAMQTLDLSVQDLFDPNQLANLVTELTDGSDVSSLLLNEDAFQTFTNLVNELGVLEEATLDQLGITKEELSDLLEQLDTGRSVEPSETIEMTDVQMDVKSDPDGVFQEAENVFTSQESSTDSDQMSFLSDYEESSQEYKENSFLTEETGTDENVELLKEQNSAASLETEKVPAGNEAMSGIQLGETAAANGTTEGTSTTNAFLNSYLDVKDIIDQISEQIKVTVREDMSKLEMQLYPEHLGKVSIQLVSKEGAVTAQLSAQNQAVKEVLESQIVLLRERMDSQGLKVEAVEVTLESHGFERNLDQNQSDSNQQAKPQNSTRRQLQIDSLDGMEELTEEEELITNIMVGNGNSIDYTA